MIEQEAKSLDLREYLRAFKRRFWIMAGVFVTLVVTAGLTSMRMTPIYESSTRVEVQPVSANTSDEILRSLFEGNEALATQVELIQSDAVLTKAADELGVSLRSLKRSLEVQRVGETQIVELSVRHEDPETTQVWADAVANAYINFRRERALEAVVSATEGLSRRMEEIKSRIEQLDQARNSAQPAVISERDTLVARLGALEAQQQTLPDAEALSRGGGTIIVPAQVPTSPVSPKILQNLLLAAVLGIALAIGVAFLAEALDDRLRSPEEVEKTVGAPVLGYIPYVKQWPKSVDFLAGLNAPQSGGAEAFRTLRANLGFLSMDLPLRTLLVTSSVSEEGKSTTAANLAVAFAQSGKRTILVSADLRRPQAHKFFGLSDTKGLLDALDPDFPLDQALHANTIPNLRIMPDGGIPSNPTEILASSRFARLLRSLSESADLVIVDSPPVLGLADSSVLASRTDGVIFVIDTKQVTRRSLSHAVDQLRKAGGRILGAVMNAVEPEQGYGYYYQYYYDRYSQNDKAQDSTPTARAEGPSKLQ